MNLVKRESASNGDCHWAWKLKPDRVADAGVHFLRDTENTAETEIECEGEGRGRATSGRIADAGRGGDGGGGERWKARRMCEGLEVYNATIAGCDRSCKLRAGNLGTVYVNLREEDAGSGEDGMMAERAVVEMSARARMRTRVRGCIDTSLRRWFVIL